MLILLRLLLLLLLTCTSMINKIIDCRFWGWRRRFRICLTFVRKWWRISVIAHPVSGTAMTIRILLSLLLMMMMLRMMGMIKGGVMMLSRIISAGLRIALVWWGHNKILLNTILLLMIRWVWFNLMLMMKIMMIVRMMILILKMTWWNTRRGTWVRWWMH